MSCNKRSVQVEGKLVALDSAWQSPCLPVKVASSTAGNT